MPHLFSKFALVLVQAALSKRKKKKEVESRLKSAQIAQMSVKENGSIFFEK